MSEPFDVDYESALLKGDRDAELEQSRFRLLKRTNTVFSGHT